jgi:hypothetical protein
LSDTLLSPHHKAIKIMQTSVDPTGMLQPQEKEDEEDEEVALLYGNGNPQEDSNEPPQLRSRKDFLPRNSQISGDGLAQRRERRPRCQKRPNVQCLAVTLSGMTIVSLAVAVVWYSYELFNHGYVCFASCIFLLIIDDVYTMENARNETDLYH